MKAIFDLTVPAGVIMLHHGITGYPRVTVSSPARASVNAITNVTAPGHCRIELPYPGADLAEIFPIRITITDDTT